MTLKLIKFTQQIKQPLVKMAIAGTGKAGKTFFSVAHDLKTLFICTELSQANLAIDAAVQLGKAKAENITTVGINDLDTLDEALKHAISNTDDYDLVVIDNLSGIEEMVEQAIEGTKAVKNRNGEPDTHKFYKTLGNKMRAFMGLMAKIDNNLLVLVHVKEAQDSDGNQMIRLALAGNISKNMLRKSFNLIGYLSKVRSKGEIQRKITFESPSQYLNFTGGHPNLDSREDADLTAIMAKLKGSK